MERPKASVIVPLHNDEKNISFCLDSLLAQTYRDIEIIIVENGSRDNGYLICEDYASRDSRIKLLTTEVMGVSHARNMALDIARGNYIFFCDSDDYMEPDMLECLILVLEQETTEIVVCDFAFSTSHNERIIQDGLDELELWDYQTLAKKMLVDNTVMGTVWNKGFSRSIIGSIRFDESLTHSEDFYFIMQILSANRNCMACHINRCLYHYFANPNSLTNDINKTIDEHGNSKYAVAFKKMLVLNFPEEICRLLYARFFIHAVETLYAKDATVLDSEYNETIHDIWYYWRFYFFARQYNCEQKLRMIYRLLRKRKVLRKHC